MNIKKYTKIMMVGLALTLTGCTTINPYTGEQQTSNIAKGAGMGAVAGALIGAMTGNRKTALVGALIGATAGGGAGYYLDVQESTLRQKLNGTGVSVTRVGETLVLNMPSNIAFRTNSADISSRAYQPLDAVALVVKEYSDTMVSVVGHTDNTGDNILNQELSEQRAYSVANYLKSQGVQNYRLHVAGKGARQPVADNNSYQGRSVNRRVEITLSK